MKYQLIHNSIVYFCFVINKMSKTENICEKSDDKSIVFEKSSFERFGDDLIELILSYLTISDAFSLECLSKQVQSLIFNKILNLDLIDGHKSTTINNYKKFEYILTKFKNLETFSGICFDERVIRIIANNCHHLTNISIDFREVTDIPSDHLIYFAQKCGPNLQSLKFEGLSDEQIRQLLPFFTRIAYNNCR